MTNKIEVGYLDTIKKDVFDYFKGDVQKTITWFQTKNPALGDVTPLYMIIMGRHEKLEKFIKSSLEDNLR